MKKLVVSAVLLGILSGPAFAQKKENEPLEVQDRDKKQQQDALDQQYKRTLDRTRKEGEPVRADPWANMRGSGDGKR